MKKFGFTTCTVTALLVLTNLARSGDDKEPRAIINKALKAHGGEAALAKFAGQAMKGAGKFFGLGEPVDFSIDITVQRNKQLRFAVDLKIMNQDIRVEAGVNGDKGWEKQ